jgi:hypothetical protein
MKRLTWTVVLNVLAGAGCLLYLAYWSRKRDSEIREDEKLDESLEESFPASDPLPY